MIFMRYNGRPFRSEAVKVRRCLRWFSQTVIPYVPSCWVVFPVYANLRTMSMDKRTTSKSTQLSTKVWVKLLLLLENAIKLNLRPSN